MVPILSISYKKPPYSGHLPITATDDWSQMVGAIRGSTVTINSPINDTITVMTKEIRNLWERSGIPMSDYRRCWDIVKQCVTKWTSAKKSEKEEPKFQSNLNTLLDLHPVNCQTLSSLKTYMKNKDR